MDQQTDGLYYYQKIQAIYRSKIEGRNLKKQRLKDLEKSETYKKILEQI